MNKRNNTKTDIKALKGFLILWLTHAFSALGSSMTSFALVIWSYQQQGSALKTAMLSICSYAPYVMVSIFAGAFSDRWKKKHIMLICDAFAALCTLVTAVLLHMGELQIWHLYVLNALNGLMNTLQQPAQTRPLQAFPDYAAALRIHYRSGRHHRLALQAQSVRLSLLPELPIRRRAGRQPDPGIPPAHCR